MDRTLWNDAVIFNFELRSMNISLFVNVNTTTGQERFLTTREYVLQNADRVVFVADSDPEKMADNIRSFQELVAFTKDTHIPILIQLNNRDLPNAVSEKKFLYCLVNFLRWFFFHSFYFHSN
jgi:signal recognition particle receptor subunit beta